MGTLSKAKSGLEAQVEDLKSELETESSVSGKIIVYSSLA